MAKIAYMFAGQGAQYPGMGSDLYESSPAARAVFDMGEKIRPGTLEQCFSGTTEALNETVNAQPCLFLTDLAAALALDEATGRRADVCAGFSLGEIAALAYAGILSCEDEFKLVVRRGEAMHACSQKTPGGMAAVLRLDEETVRSLCAEFDGVYPVNFNCPGQIACAGKAESIDSFCDAVKNAGGRAVKIAVSGPFHTPFMADCAAVLKETLNGFTVNAPEISLYANWTAQPYPADKAGITEHIARQCMNSVQWEKTMRNMNADIYIEVGAGKTLAGLCKKTLTDVQIYNVADAAALSTVKEALQNG